MFEPGSKWQIPALFWLRNRFPSSVSIFQPSIWEEKDAPNTDCSASHHSLCQTWKTQYSTSFKAEVYLAALDSNTECSELLQAGVIEDVRVSWFRPFICTEQPSPPTWAAVNRTHFCLFAVESWTCIHTGKAFYFSARISCCSSLGLWLFLLFYLLCWEADINMRRKSVLLTLQCGF